MSAGICIMNKNAIAMAADSAVTVGDHVAIHNSANKLFTLSRVAPVGVIVYSNATLMSTPIEIIVKQYKLHLGDRVFPHLRDYVDNFLNYLEDHSSFFRFAINEQNYVLQVFANLIKGMYGDYNRLLQSNKNDKPQMIDENEERLIAESAVKITLDFVDKCSKRQDYSFSKYVEDKYLTLVIDSVRMDPNLQWISEDQRVAICKKACELFDTDFERNGFVGLAVAGYGENEIYPHLIHLHIHGVIDNKLKYKIAEKREISESKPAAIAPLAQTDVMETFLFGINDQFIDDLAQEIPKQIEDCMKSIDESYFAKDRKDDVNSKMHSVTEKIIQHMKENAIQNYMLPIIQSVSSLPKEELALLAESMINITSIRRKVAIDRNIGTVGGPIDVALISKGDGFIWIKRKHYFDGQYNPQYFYSHFEKKTGGAWYE